MPILVITRDRALPGAVVPYAVSVDSEIVGRLWAGRSMTVDVPAGSHLLEVYSGNARWCSGRVVAGQSYVLTHPKLRLSGLPRAIWCGVRPNLVQVND